MVDEWRSEDRGKMLKTGINVINSEKIGKSSS